MTTTDPYEFGNAELDPDQDQRQEFRLVGRAKVALELEAAEPGDTAEARLTVASSTDISSGGLRLTTDEALLPGALLPARVQLPDTPKPCLLTVEVIWCQPAGVNRWQSGLKILDTGDRAYLDWMEAIARAMEAG